MTSRLQAVVLLALASVLLVACGDGGDDPAGPTATVTVEPGAPVAGSTPPPIAALGDIVWTSGVAAATGAPVDALASLPNDAAQVIAAVQVDSLPEGVTLQARWTIDGEPLTALEPDPLVIDDARTDAWIAWTLTWTSDQPWPIGRLGIAIEVNGEVQASDDIFIVRARE